MSLQLPTRVRPVPDDVSAKAARSLPGRPTHRRREARSSTVQGWLGRAGTVALSGVLCLTLAACAGAAQDGPSQAGVQDTDAQGAASEVVIAAGSEPDTLNPVLGHARWGDGKITEGLVQLTAELEVEPLLATALPQVSDDGLTYTYSLREGVTFHDGSMLDSTDVVATYEAALNPANASPVAADLTALKSVETVDERTVRFTLDHAQSAFPITTVLGIVPSEQLEGELAATSTVIGTGPYQMGTYRPGDRLVLTSFDDYWGDRPTVERATFVFADDDPARVARLASGEVDGALLPAPSLVRFENHEEFDVIRRATADFRALVLPEQHAVTGDHAIRRALHTGLDRQALVDGALAGAGRPAFSPIPPEAMEYSDVLEVEADPNAARRWLDDAGWIEGRDGVREKDGQRASFTLMYPAGDSLRQNIALEVQAQAGDLGIDVQPEGLSWEAIEPRMPIDALIYGTGNPFNADLSTYPLFHSSRAFVGFDNPGGYRSPEMDAALEAGRTALDDGSRVAAYQDVQARLVQDLPWIFLAYVEHDYVIRADTWDGYDVQLVEPHEHGLQGGPWWNLPAWTAAD